jgi:hypothetical protein
MTTVVLTRVPRDLGWPHLVRAICAHVRVPVSSQTYWAHGYGDIHIDLGATSVAAAVYAVELYTLVLGVEYRVLEEGHNLVTNLRT